MRQDILLSIIHKHTHLIIIVLFAVLIALFGSFQNEQFKVKAEETKNISEPTGLAITDQNSNQNLQTTEESSSQDESSSNGSSKNNFKVSINSSSNTTVNNSSNSFKISTSINGETTGSLVDKCIENGKVRERRGGKKFDCNYKSEDGSFEFEFESETDQDSENDFDVKVSVSEEKNN